MLRRLSLWLALTLILPPALFAEPPKLLEVELPTGTIEGMPVHWGNSDAAILDQAGGFHWFDLDQVRQHRVLQRNFVPQSLPEARSELQRELGTDFETLISGPYVIATPTGQAARWQARFMSLLSGYTRFFQVRGWPLRQPDFPLIVVVFDSRDQFLRYAAQKHGQLPSQAVGSYFPQSNRCILYQIDGYRGVDWAETEATIVHEAVHQLAYNTGVHERLFRNPLWFVEGLATMFEQPAVYDLGLDRSNIAARIHPGKLRDIQHLVMDPPKLARQLAELIESDALFESDAQQAYALGWALTFFLTERMPVEYETLVECQRQRGFGSYSGRQRRSDFSSACPVELDLLAVQMARFFAQAR